MALMSGTEYLRSLERLHPTSYILGQKISNPYEHPLIHPMVMGVARTYDLHHDPEGAKYLVTHNERLADVCSRRCRLENGVLTDS